MSEGLIRSKRIKEDDVVYLLAHRYNGTKWTLQVSKERIFFL